MMKRPGYTGILFAILTFLLFFVWGTRGKPWILITSFWPTLHIIYGIAALFLFLSFVFIPSVVKKFSGWLIKYRFFIFPSISLVAAILITLLVFEGVPHIIDASHFLYGARLLLQGKFSLASSELYEFFNAPFMVNNYNGQTFSLFLPGTAPFFAVFLLLGVPWLLTPLCTALSVWLIGKITDIWAKNDRISFFTMFLTSTSTLYLMMGTSFMSHSLNLFLILMAVYIVMKVPDRKSWLFCAGFLISIILFIRPQNAVFVYIPVVLYLAIAKKTGIKPLLFFTLPFLIMGSLLLLYNYYLTGSPLLFPQDVFFLIREPHPFCHRMGLGTGCHNTEGWFLPEEGLTFSYAFWVSYSRLTLLLLHLSAHPYIFVFVSLAFLFYWKKQIFFFSLFFAFFAGYFFFYLSGNLFGPRYFSEVAVFLLAIGAFGFVVIFERARMPGKALLAALPVAAFTFLVLFILPKNLEIYSDSFWRVDRSIEYEIEKSGITDSIIFVPRLYETIILNLQENPPYDRHDNLIVRDLGEADSYAAAWLMEKNHFKNAYLVEYHPKMDNFVRIRPLDVISPGDIWIDFEAKGKPVSGKPDYATEIYMVTSVAPDPVRLFPIKRIDENLAPHEDAVYGILFKKLGPESYYDITHPILIEGTYLITLGILTAPCGETFTLKINGNDITDFSSYSQAQALTTLSFTVYLKEGKNTFSFYPHLPNTCLILDYLHLSLE